MRKYKTIIQSVNMVSTENPQKAPSYLVYCLPKGKPGSEEAGSKTLAGLIGFQPLQTKSPLEEQEQEGLILQERKKHWREKMINLLCALPIFDKQR